MSVKNLSSSSFSFHGARFESYRDVAFWIAYYGFYIVCEPAVNSINLCVCIALIIIVSRFSYYFIYDYIKM